MEHASRRPDAVAVLTSARVAVRDLTMSDAPFIVTLLNDSDFIRNIGDRGVRTETDACEYLRAGPLASYARHGFGLRAVTPAGTDEPMGICGLLKRDTLPHPDLGFAFLPPFRARGYAFEAATLVIDDARARLRVQTVLAIVNPENAASIRLLERLRFRSVGTTRLAGDSPELLLFSADL